MGSQLHVAGDGTQTVQILCRNMLPARLVGDHYVAVGSRGLLHGLARSLHVGTEGVRCHGPVVAARSHSELVARVLIVPA